MSKARANTYEDDDLRSVIEEIESLDAECETIMARARGEVSGLRAKQKAKKKIAADELGIPRGILLPLLKRRKLERQIAKVDDGVDEDLVEVYEDARGQFSFFAPGEGGEQVPKAKRSKGKTVKEAAAESDAALKASIAATEQGEGEEVLSVVGNGHDPIGFEDAR